MNLLNIIIQPLPTKLLFADLHKNIKIFLKVIARALRTSFVLAIIFSWSFFFFYRYYAGTKVIHHTLHNFHCYHQITKMVKKFYIRVAIENMRKLFELKLPWKNILPYGLPVWWLQHFHASKKMQIFQL